MRDSDEADVDEDLEASMGNALPDEDDDSVSTEESMGKNAQESEEDFLSLLEALEFERDGLLPGEEYQEPEVEPEKDLLVPEHEEDVVDAVEESLHDEIIKIDPPAVEPLPRKEHVHLIVAVDIGSSSIRCSAYEKDDGHILTTSSIKRSNVEPITGKIRLRESDTEKSSSLLDTVDQCMDELLAQLRAAYGTEGPSSWEIVGVGFASFVMNLVGVDQDGHAVGEKETISYACSSDSCSKQVDDLKRELGIEGERLLYQKTGTPIHSAYALAQLRVLYSGGNRNQSIYTWQTLASICLSRWTGRKHVPISYSEASWTGLFNYSRCDYEETAIRLLPDSCIKTLPKLADYDSRDKAITTRIPETSPYWERWKALRKARLFLGLGDGACANIGSKCTTGIRIAVTVGTSAAARVCIKRPILGTTSTQTATSNEPQQQEQEQQMSVAPGLFCYRIDRSYILVGGALTDGGSVIAWLKQLLNLQNDKAFEDCMNEVNELVEEDVSSQQNSFAASPANTNTLTTVPFFNGERSTGFRTGATGAIFGLTHETTPARLVKSCLEGVTLRLTAIIRRIHEVTALESSLDASSSELLLPPRSYIVASGKALEANPVWRQMIADCSGLDVLLDNDTVEGTSRGVALLVARALERAGDDEEQEEEDMTTTSTPDDELGNLTPRHQSMTNDDYDDLKEEAIDSTGVSRHRHNRALYWARASEAQEGMIDALSPLFVHK